MPKVEMEGFSPKSHSITLKNGDLIIAGGQPLMVTSYRSGRDNNNGQEAQYCSMINLTNGQNVFREPCTRKKTSLARIHVHLRNRLNNLTLEDLDIVDRDSYMLTLKPLGSG